MPRTLFEGGFDRARIEADNFPATHEQHRRAGRQQRLILRRALFIALNIALSKRYLFSENQARACAQYGHVTEDTI